MAAGSPSAPLACLLAALLVCLGSPTLISASPIGDENEYSFSLIHRDSESSPIKRNWSSTRERFEYYLNASRSREEFFTMVIRRKLNESSGDLYRTSGNSEDINVFNKILSFGEYVLQMYMSDKRLEQYLTYDTGSALVWVQCKPCDPCFKQPSPTYDISKSKTAKVLPCSKCTFDSLPLSGCFNKQCVFGYAYADGSSLSGYLVTERFNFGGVHNYNLVFGCATSSDKMVNSPDGLAGFSPGSTSLPYQLSKVSGRNAFASCLVRYGLDKANMLSIGPKALAHSGVSYTPIVNPSGVGRTELYRVEVLKVTVGNTVLKIPYSAFNNEYGTMIDSGTPLTLLNKQAMDPILSEIKRIGEKKFKVVKSSSFPLCFKWTQTNQLLYNTYFPPITFTFKGNVDVKILGYNYMGSLGDGQVCVTFNLAYNINILGSLFQQNLLVVHDVDKMRLGFKPMDCVTGKAR